MAMAVGGKKGGPQSDINVTPMIDILLVLLIIFMVVQQGLQKGLSVQVPPIEESDAPVQSIDQIVLQIDAGQQYSINQQPVAASGLVAKLHEIYDNRPRKVLFVQGAETISYADVIFAVDAANAAGVKVVGLVPRATS